MPPYVPRKRLREDSPERRQEAPKKKGKTAAAIAPPRKATLADALDSTVSPEAKAKARQQVLESDGDDSSLSSLSDADFEDVPAAKKQWFEKDEADEDEDMEFEDVTHPSTLAPQQLTDALELRLTDIPNPSYTDFGGKKGPSKSERRIRSVTHCIHVQFLMWHNAIRNGWLCDPIVQGIMLSHIPSGMWDEIDRFRRNSGGLDPRKNNTKQSAKASKSKAKGKGKQAARDWGAAERLEKGAVDMSFGDPVFRLLRTLSAWWRKRFRITAPGTRKIGYLETRRCTNLIKGYKQGGTKPERYGERISNLEWFRLRAQECAGSRDVGAQLFTALLRALGLEARMVASLQPAGFGFNKLEDAEDEKKEQQDHNATPVKTNGVAETAKKVVSKLTKSEEKKTAGPKKQPRQSDRSSRHKGQQTVKESSDEPEDDDLELSGSDGDSLVEIPQLKTSRKTMSVKFDKDLEWPHYWSEVLSPATHKYVPVDAIVKNFVGTTRDLVESFEPRGAKADKAKQVMAYVVGYSDDGSAKDVTVRYLKQQVFPGRAKATRMPLEKTPVYNKNGKVKRYDHFDWFKSIMRGYARGGESHPLTDIDYDEDLTDLKAAQPQKKEVKEGEETLQHFKQSKEFVLARHLKREEALLPDAEPVKVFRNKTKGKKGEPDEEPVYLRKDIVQVKSEETWHKQGRAPKPGVQPRKHAPYRAATTNRRRELAEAEALAGRKVLQGLYSIDQTDWIIPPPIENGVIPKNQYGNIDLFVEHMLPEGAAHVPYRGAIRVCKRLEIDYAEAVVDFEFGNRMAVPVIQGVVIAEEHFDNVMEELAKDEAEKKRKEDEKRIKAVLTMWRRLLMGMRIRERIRKEYGDAKDEDINVFGHSRDQPDALQNEEPAPYQEDLGGGFLPEGYEDAGPEPDEEEEHSALRKSSFFATVDEEEDDGSDGDGLVVEDGAAANASRPSAEAATDADEGSSRRRRRRPVVPSSDEEDEIEDDDDDDDDENMGDEDYEG